MKIYLNKTVLQAAKERISYLFDEFEEVIVSMSGGKDSTVCLELCFDVAKEKNKLPLKVMWIDQEAEWEGTVKYMSEVLTRDHIVPMWFQMPMVITNNATSYERFAHCWDHKNKHKWIHDQSEMSIKTNTYGTERFHDLFGAILKKEYHNKKACYIAGVRAEENPKRAMVLTTGVTYKGITWGKKLSKSHFTFYPIYDWSYTDVWKYICENKFKYNRVYDEMFRYGLKVNEMRISNLHHETAIQHLTQVQEIEPQTWAKLQKRIDGANTIKQLKKNAFVCPNMLPKAFSTWREYAHYLADNIIQKEGDKDAWEKQIGYDHQFSFIDKNESISTDFWKVAINTILSSDWDFTKIQNFRLTQSVNAHRQYYRGTYTSEMLKHTKYLSSDQIKRIKDAVNR